MTKDSETSAEDFFPDRKSLKAFREAAADCQACDLWKRGTQIVFGEGARHAEIVFIGEQPGNEEDLSGKPFVGPAGRLLDEALIEAGIDRTQTYVTNVVKHLNGSHVVNVAFIKNQTPKKLPPAVHGSKLRLV